MTIQMQPYAQSPPQATRLDRPEWTAKKRIGNAGEVLAHRFANSIGLLVQRHHGQSPHDLTAMGRIEIKTDLMAASTGNLAVEVGYKGQPSGIATSQSTAWWIVAAGELILCRTHSLRELVRHGRYPRVAGGESATVCLVPIGDIRRIARSFRIREARP